MATKKGAAPTRRKCKTALLATVTYVDYKDVNLLRTFISDRGRSAPAGSPD